MTDTYSTFSTIDLLKALERAGRGPHPDLIRAIYERRETAEALVLDLFAASFHDQWPASDPRWYRFLHAGKLLIAWRTEAALPVFARMYLDDRTQDECEWFETDPAYFGPPAVPHFARVVQADTRGRWHYGRSLASTLLSEIGRHHPECRDEIITALRSVLPEAEAIPALAAADPETAWGDPWDEMWGPIIGDLGELRDEGSKELILAMLDADIVDTMHIDRALYLRQMRGDVPIYDRPFDLLGFYTAMHQEALEDLAREKRAQRREARESAIRPATARAEAKVGRNDPCPCGSGKKYKQCHGKPTARG